nr:casein kinase I [Drosophila takahashii]
MSFQSESLEDYTLGRKMGSGSFGDIYEATHRKSGLQVALKLERSDIANPQLLFEYKLYNILRHGMGIPQVYHYHTNHRFNVMVMELLGPSLEDLFVLCQRNFSLKTVLMVAEQMIERLEYVHSHRYLHRDIKPENLLMGRDDAGHRLYLIDFGLAKRYWDAATDKHVRPRAGSRLTGTARYASINALRGGQQSRRDDIEAMGYVLMYFLRGSLPWQGLTANQKQQKHEMICEMKLSTQPEVLCEGYPEAFYHFVGYSRALGFEEEPHYKDIRYTFLALMYTLKFPNDQIYDWDIVKKHILEAVGAKDQEEEEAAVEID